MDHRAAVTLLAGVLVLTAAPARADDGGAADPGQQGEPQPGASRAETRARTKALKKRARLVPHYEYLEDSYLDYALPNTGPVDDARLIFEAQSATHLFLVNQWDRVESVSSPGAMASVLSWDLSFLLLLRMVDEKSAPIRPPSYMPATHFQWFGLWKARSGAVHELETELGLTHHSNGQQQCSFVPDGQQDDQSPDTCLTGPALHRPLRRNVNYRSGDFSTSYSTAGLHYAYMTLDADRYLVARGSLGVVFEHDFVVDRGIFGGFPGAIDHDQAALYGIHRVRFEGQGRLHLGHAENPLSGVLTASASHELMWNTGPSIPGNRTIAEASYTADGFHGLGLFVRGSTGQDRLNILYAAGRANVLQLGLIWSTSPAVRYRFGEGEPAGD